MSLSEQQSPEYQQAMPLIDAGGDDITISENAESYEILSEKEEAHGIPEEHREGEAFLHDGEHHQHEKGYRQAFEAFLSEFNQQIDPEAKLQKAIAFMEASLSQGGTPHFKSFWEARNLSMELFKQNIPAASRANLWSKYSELSKEARRLKDILEEQSAFAAEQIEIAIQALEEEITNNVAKIDSLQTVEFPNYAKSLESNLHYYQGIQKELNFLNAQAARINALRKELIKTEMRIRQKNKFFQRLSSAGDKVFPRRKELIKEVSQKFSEDVNYFINENFAKNDFQDHLFFFREEIKALQGMAKQLTLNTHSFTQTRVQLSECWDKIKGVEKERKKVRAQQKSIFKSNHDEVKQKIDQFSEAFSAGQLSNTDAQKKLDEISVFMRQMELGRDEVKELREELLNARKPLAEKLKNEEQDRLNQEQEKEKQRKKRFNDLKEECENLFRCSEACDAENLIAKRDELYEKICQSSISKLEKQELERMLKPLRDLIAEKKERALLALSDDDRQHLDHLKELLKEKKELRNEIKQQIETYRKAVAGSGLDFEQAMRYNTLIAAEKERLEKVNQGLKEIEHKIDVIENK